MLGRAIALTLLLCASLAAGQRVVVASPYTDVIEQFDLAMGAYVPGTQVTLSDSLGVSTFTGCNGMTVHPATGAVYIIVKVTGATGRSLGTLDLATGVVTIIGNTGDSVAGITFDGSGTLWGVLGDGAAMGETVVTIDPGTAALTPQVVLGAGSDGETIVFHPGTGLLYTVSGRDTAPAVTSIDPGTLATAPITRAGFNSDEMFSLCYHAASGLVHGANLDQEIVTLDFSVPGTVNITNTGLTTVFTVAGPDYWKGMILLEGSCSIASPAAMATVPAPVDIVFDLNMFGGAMVDATLEFSTDAGATWAMMTPDASSPLPNPATGLATPAVGATFRWAAGADGVATTMPTPVSVRIGTSPPSLLASCGVDFVVEPGCPGACGDCDLNLAGPNILDSLTSAQIAAGLSTPSMAQTFCCDVNASGAIEILDALLMAQFAAGLPVTLTCP